MGRPVFSLVSAVYGVAEYLPAFLESLDSQTFDHGRFEVVFVLDGAVDASPEIVRAWASGTDVAVTIVEQGNAGVASARNAGLARARGRWVSFPDPDDVLAPDYLAQVEAWRRRGWRRVDAIVARTVLTDGEATWEHPLDWRFADGSGVLALEGEHDFINLATNCCFFPAALLRRSGVRFRGDVRPSFEDAVFFAEALLSVERPRVGVCAEATYRYRKRASGDSLVQAGWRGAERFTTLLESGYLRLLEVARARRGFVPRWCQDAVLYDLGWVFYSDARGRLDATVLAGEVGVRFRELCGRIASELDMQRIVATRQTTCEASAKVALVVRREDVAVAAVVQDGAVVEAFVGVEDPASADVRVGGVPWAAVLSGGDVDAGGSCRIPRWVGRPRTGLSGNG